MWHAKANVVHVTTADMAGHGVRCPCRHKCCTNATPQNVQAWQLGSGGTMLLQSHLFRRTGASRLLTLPTPWPIAEWAVSPRGTSGAPFD